MTRSVLVTGAAGYLGSLLVQDLTADSGSLETIVGTDLREPAEPVRGLTFVKGDVRDLGFVDTLRSNNVDVVVHLAAIVSPGKNPDRDLEYSVDVGGTKNVLEACVASGVEKVIVSSSGAAYGYHADNPEWIDEEDALRGNPTFAYSDHKRLVEEMLAQWREDHPQLKQLIFRPGTILGAGTRNQITDLFDRSIVFGIRGSETPFVFMWDIDVVACLRRGIETDAVGIYNLAGDGAMPLRAIAHAMEKRYVEIPAVAVRSALGVMRRFGVTQYGPEQVDFLRYRPVLSNRRLKDDFGFTPTKSSEETFAFFLEARHGTT